MHYLRSPRREEIEQDFLNWASPTRIATDHEISRDSIYRHARALDLFAKRQHNVRAALDKLIEQSGEVEVNAAAVDSADQSNAKVNAQGQWIDRSETLNLNE